MKTPKIPHPHEWDFRAVTPDCLSPAFEYECAREVDALREAACRWLEAKPKHGGKTVRARLIAARGDRRALKRIRADHSPWRRKKLPIWLWITIERHRPDFPAPWLSAPVLLTKKRMEPFFDAQTLSEFTDEIEKLAGGRTKAVKAIRALQCLRRLQEGYFVAGFCWSGATIEGITADFKRRLAQEAKRHPEMKQAGKRGQLPVEPLKWLAAYRLAKAGLTFAQVKALLPVYVDPTNERKQREATAAGLKLSEIPTALNCGAGCGLLPEFADQSGFSDAVSRTKRKLAAFESGSLEVGF